MHRSSDSESWSCEVATNTPCLTVPPTLDNHCKKMPLSTCNMSLPSASNFLPSLHCLSSQRSLRLTSNRICLSCWDSCTKTFLSWLQNFCCSRVCRLMLCSWKSHRISTFLCSSCSWELADRGRMWESQLIPVKITVLESHTIIVQEDELCRVFSIWCNVCSLVLLLFFSY